MCTMGCSIFKFKFKFQVLFSLLMALQIDTGTVKLIFGGDVTFSGVIKYHGRRSNCTYNDSFSELKPYFTESDHVIVNLESPFHQYNGKKLKVLDPKKEVVLLSDLDAMSTLSYAGIDVVTLANNHLIDFGEKPATVTIKNLKKLNISYFGVTFGKQKILKQEPLIITKNGIRIGFLGYCVTDEGCMRDNYRNQTSLGPAVYNKLLLKKELKSLRKKVDVIIVFMHWGDEYATVMPLKYGLKLILQMMPYADIIIGSHPHVKQKHFFHKNVLVVPSLGNLLFPSHGTIMEEFRDRGDNTSKVKVDNAWYKEAKLMKPETTVGKLVKIEINKNGVIKDKAKFLLTQIAVNEKHCMYVKKKDNSTWETICGKNDKDCAGTSDCNELQCDDQKKVKPKNKKKPKHTYEPLL